MKKILLWLIFFCTSFTFANPYSLKVNMVMGNVQYFDQNNPDSGWHKIKLDMKLNENYKIRTGQNSRLILTDGENLFKLSSLSVLSLKTINKDQNKLSFSLLTGKLHSIINSLMNKSEINIITPVAILAVRGTDFVATTSRQESKVFVFKGTVEASDKQNLYPSVLVKENQMSEILVRQAPTQPKKIPFSVYQKWGMPIPIKQSDSNLKKIDLYNQSNKKVSDTSIKPATQQEKSVYTSSPTKQSYSPAPSPQIINSTNLPQLPPSQQTNSQSTKPTPQISSVHKPVQTRRPKQPLKPHFNLNANIGPANINNTNFQQITLMPEFGIGQFAIGLYFPIYMNLAIGPVPATSWHNYSDWDFRNWKDGFSDAINKFLYIRYGEKGTPPVYVKAGNINNFTIGFGFLMNRYSNMVHFPEVKKFGLEFDIATTYGGFESMCSDLTLFEIYGGRFYINPLFWTHSKLLQKFNIGYSHIVDTNPSLILNEPALHFHGFDAGINVIHNNMLQLSLYANFGYAYLHDKAGKITSYQGSAFVPGLKGKFLFILYKLEYRNLSNNFPVEYFDINYEDTRTSKYLSIQPGFAGKAFNDSKGILGDLGFSFGKYGSFSTTFWDNLNSPVDDNRLHSELIIAKGLIPKIYGTVSFDKYDIVSFKDLYDNFFDYRTIMTAEGVYSADPKIDLAFIWKRTFIFNSTTAQYELNTSMSVETRFSFL